MTTETAIRYARSGDVAIAYEVRGNGPPDVVFIGGFVTHLEVARELPETRRWIDRLASFCRLVNFDKRGMGLSDRPSGARLLEQDAGDVLAVMDAAGCERATVFGVSEGGPASLVFAASHPERVSSLVIYGSYARIVAAPDYPDGVSLESLEAMRERLVGRWGDPVLLKTFAPSFASDPDVQAWWGRMLRAGTSPSGADQLLRSWAELDVRAVLPTVTAPTLVLHRASDRLTPPAWGRYLADHIPGARYIELPGDDHLFALGGDDILDEVQEFVTGERRAREPDRILATILFCDIVESTRLVAELGDRRWRSVIESHDAAVAREVRRFRGQLIKTVGDGALAAFDGAARAIECARAIRAAVQGLGLRVRVGLHSGECDVIGADLGGLAVHIGARVGARADAGEILVSGTVKDLVVGSGIAFEDRGAAELKGVPGEWRLYAVAA